MKTIIEAASQAAQARYASRHVIAEHGTLIFFAASPCWLAAIFFPSGIAHPRTPTPKVIALWNPSVKVKSCRIGLDLLSFGMHQFGKNAALVKSPPPGDFTYVSALRTGWQDELQLLIRQKHPVNFDHFPLRQFPETVHNKVQEQNYQHLTLAKDRWQHFFIPQFGELKPAAPDGMTSTGGVS